MRSTINKEYAELGVKVAMKVLGIPFRKIGLAFENNNFFEATIFLGYS